MFSMPTALAIAKNETVIIEAGDQTEVWTVKDGSPHTLLLSCPPGKRREMEVFVEGAKKVIEKEYSPEEVKDE